MNGNGKFVWNDNRTYEGQFKNNKRHGFGKFVSINGVIYIGQWTNNKQNGIGVFQNNKEDPKCGVWENGIRKKWINSYQMQQILLKFENGLEQCENINQDND
eukprot:TRINITY_DN4673_c0_g1_i1.p4 TRINITY_DN4673_c0_g1~~TRINITY_DN4673_c0_g1_i1.p4  ORF type:complete len:102 (+),score=19.50 TRINITY_DN4673_c0_g1_i1:414-719(+)